MDSKTDEGLDSLIQIHNNLFNELNFDKRFGNTLEYVKEKLKNTSLIDDEFKLTFLEFKMELTKDMDHSLMLVSHIICWEKPKSSLKQIVAKDGVYDLKDINDQLYLICNDDCIEKIVKVIPLKPTIENFLNAKYKKL